MKYFLALLSVVIIGIGQFSLAQESKDHKHSPNEKKDSHEHSESEDHAHDKDHGHEDEASKDEGESHNHEEEGHEAHGEEGHDHGEEPHAHGDEHGHGEEEHGHEDGHGHEEASNVGPNKGVLEASEEKGIKLSPEALKNFEIKTLKISGSGPWVVPASARMVSLEEVNLYRLKDGFFKRIDFSLVENKNGGLKVRSKDLAEGDEIVINGVGFLRIAEIAAFGGAPEGHAH